MYISYKFVYENYDMHFIFVSHENLLQGFSCAVHAVGAGNNVSADRSL